MATGISTLEVDGLLCTVERKSISKLYLRLGADGSIRLSVPRTVKDETLREFVRSRWEWIARQRATLAVHYVPAYVTGEGFWLWGRCHLLQLREGRPGVALEGGVLRISAPADSSSEWRRMLLERWYTRQMELVLPALVAEAEALTGLHAATWQLREMTSRWGSCSPASAAIRLNTQLARRQPDFLRYVIIHELAHLRERGHGPKFYALLDGWCPNWRELRQGLKQDLRVLAPGFALETDGNH